MDIDIAKQKLLTENCACVFVKGKDVFISFDKGISKLLEIYDSHKDYSEYSVADKIVGKAAAFIYILLKIKYLYADVISKDAYEILIKNKIKVTYKQIVPYIINRKGDGLCPMEDAVKNIVEPLDAPDAIKHRLAELKNIK